MCHALSQHHAACSCSLTCLALSRHHAAFSCSLMCLTLSQHHAACSCSLTCLALSQHATHRSSVLCLVQATLSCRSLNSTPSGLVVHPEHHWIAASPDGLVNDPSSPDTLGIVEFKNPYAEREKPLIEAAKDKNFCLAFKNNCLSLKHTHQCYYQVQVTMFCTKRKWCDFVVRTTDLHIERIQFNPQFWMPVLNIATQVLFHSHSS